MTFADIDEKKENTNSKFRKTEYMQTGEGTHVIRIVESPAKKYYVHTAGFSYIRCLGDECPICENNKKIMYEHPDDFREQKLWKPRSERFYVNVLDKTPAKVCMSCGVETKNTSLSSCPKCSSVLLEAQPLNKIKVLAKGKTLFEDLNLLSNANRDAQNEVVDIRLYDWLLLVKGSGKDTTTVASPRWVAGAENEQSLEGLELFDLTNVVPTLTREEMIDVLNGASLKDIFAIRRAVKEGTGETKVTGGDPVLMNDIQESLKELFKD